MVDQNSDFLCTFTACLEQDTIWEFVGTVVGTDCLVTIRDVDMPLYPNLAFFVWRGYFMLCTNNLPPLCPLCAADRCC